MPAPQAPPAVGRALAVPLGVATLGKEALFPKNAVSLVSVGDGSVNNAMFLAAVNMAEYARFRGRKCPVLFAVTDNQLCISLRGHGWLDAFLDQRVGMPVFRACGTELGEVYAQASGTVRCSCAAPERCVPLRVRATPLLWTTSVAAQPFRARGGMTRSRRAPDASNWRLVCQQPMSHELPWSPNMPPLPSAPAAD